MTNFVTHQEVINNLRCHLPLRESQDTGLNVEGWVSTGWCSTTKFSVAKLAENSLGLQVDHGCSFQWLHHNIKNHPVGVVSALL